VFSGATGAELFSFFAYGDAISGSGFSGGVRVAGGDVNGDGRDDVITGVGAGAGPHVKVFDGRTGAEVRSFFAFDPGFGNGIFVAGGDVNGDSRADVVVGSDRGTQTHVKAFSGADTGELASFLPYVGFAGGVRVGVGDVDGDGLGDILTGAGPGAGPHAKAFAGGTFAEFQSYFAFDPGFDGGIFIASGGTLPAAVARRAADVVEQPAEADSWLPPLETGQASKLALRPAPPVEAFFWPESTIPASPAAVDAVFTGESLLPPDDLIEGFAPMEIDLADPDWFDAVQKK
jgi:hypothetical protein